MQKILVIEDERSLLEMIQLNLELEGYKVTTCVHGRDALTYARQLDQFDLVILDIMLPEVSGLDICKEYRAHSDIPILILSAKGTTSDRIAGLKLGANDYLPKPFDLEELLLRVNNLIKTWDKISVTTDVLHIGNWEVSFATYEVINSSSGEKQELSKREIELLQLFLQQKDKVVSRDEILNALWGTEQFPTGRTIDNYILNFRKLFEPDSRTPIYFHSIRGVGYKFTLPDV